MMNENLSFFSIHIYIHSERFSTLFASVWYRCVRSLRRIDLYTLAQLTLYSGIDTITQNKKKRIFNLHHIKWRHIVIWCAHTGKSIYDLSHRRTLQTLLWSLTLFILFCARVVRTRMLYSEHCICKLRPQRKTWSISCYTFGISALQFEISSIFVRYIILIVSAQHSNMWNDGIFSDQLQRYNKFGICRFCFEGLCVSECIV